MQFWSATFDNEDYDEKTRLPCRRFIWLMATLQVTYVSYKECEICYMLELFVRLKDLDDVASSAHSASTI